MQYAPVSGTIEEINERLSDQPGLLNKSAEDEGELAIPIIAFYSRAVEGWLCKIKISSPSEVSPRAL